MINVSQTIKNSCKADSNTHTEYIVINNQTIYIKGKLSATAYKDTTFFGTFNMKVLEFETQNTTQFRNREFEYYKVIDGNAFKIGTFITTEVNDNDSKETVKVTANDYALKFAVPYTTELNYNNGTITLFQVLQECCTKAGVVLENQSIDNGNFIVDSNQFVNGELIGDVISAVAGISGNFATITNQDKLRLTFANNTDEILSDYTSLEDKRDTQPITSVSVGLSQVQGVEAILRDETLIAQYGEHWLILNDNPFAYTLTKRQQLVTAIFNKVKGFGYSSFKSEYTYRPYLELGDKIKFKNKSGQLIDSIILKYTFDNDKCTFEAPSITKAEVDYEKSPDAKEIAKRAEIIANQAEATITATTSKVEELSIKVDGGSEYNLTTDTTFQENKEYFIKDGDEYIEYLQYKEYLGDRTGNPSELGLYEPVFSPTYVATDDTTFESGKTYYEYDEENDTYEEYEGSTSGNPAELGLYELTQEIVDYELTEDTEFEENKDYYVKQYDIGDTIPSNTYYEKKTYNGIENDYTEITNALRNKADVSSVQSIQTTVKTLQTNTYSKTQVQEIANGNGYFKSEDTEFGATTVYYQYNSLTQKYDVYSGARTGSPNELGLYEFGLVSAIVSTEATFNKDGMRYTKTNGKTESLINLNGLEVDNLTRDDTTGSITGRDIGLYAGYVPSDATFVGDLYKGQTIVYTKNLISRGYTEVGVHGRFEEYAGPNNENGVGFFII